MAVKSISILGATGSIGDSTLDLVRHHSDQYDVRVLTAGSNVERLISLTSEFKPKYVAIADKSKHSAFQSAHPNIEILSVDDAASVEADWTMAAITGTVGLKPTMNAIERGQTVAFASKECLVAAGNLMMQAVSDSGATLLPVDSEHNAIFQVFDNEQRDNIERLLITCSGGPFRTWSQNEINAATPAQALKHPTWSMGAKISIDSASLMNKALEVIEAHYLFNMPSDKIDVIVHPQSLIHSMVEYSDGSILSQMGPSDMRTPIAHCLGWPERIRTSGQRLDFSKVSSMTFEKPDLNRFKSLAMVRDVMADGQGASIVFNAANEIAVEAFLKEQIGFDQIYDVIDQCLQTLKSTNIITLDDVVECDENARLIAQQYISTTDRKPHYA